MQQVGTFRFSDDVPKKYHADGWRRKRAAWVSCSGRVILISAAHFRMVRFSRVRKTNGGIMAASISMRSFIQALPKAELHIHLEGALEPELALGFARRNRMALRFGSVEELRKSYQFTGLQSFLNLYYECTAALVTEQDFYDLTLSYLRRAADDGVRHAELFFDPQSHTSRGVSFETVITGIRHALELGKQQYTISSNLIMCFLRHLSAEQAMETLEVALPFKQWIVGVGLDSSELGHPPMKFAAGARCAQGRTHRSRCARPRGRFADTAFGEGANCSDGVSVIEREAWRVSVDKSAQSKAATRCRSAGDDQLG